MADVPAVFLWASSFFIVAYRFCELETFDTVIVYRDCTGKQNEWLISTGDIWTQWSLSFSTGTYIFNSFDNRI